MKNRIEIKSPPEYRVPAANEEGGAGLVISALLELIPCTVACCTAQPLRPTAIIKLLVLSLPQSTVQTLITNKKMMLLQPKRSSKSSPLLLLQLALVLLVSTASAKRVAFRYDGINHAGCKSSSYDVELTDMAVSCNGDVHCFPGSTASVSGHRKFYSVFLCVYMNLSHIYAVFSCT